MPLSPDPISWSGILNAHLRAGNPDAARTIFDQTIPAGKRDVVSWTTMISGYAKAGRPRDALQLFVEMPMLPDEVTMVALVTACATARDLEAGEKLHMYAEERGLSWMVAFRNTLIDMYAKCGCLWRARQVFDEMAEGNRSLVTWNTMIWAHAAHGDVDGAIHLFGRMSSSGEGGRLNADGVTNLAVLSACVHAGRVDEGQKLFGEMTAMGAEIRVEHYGCMVDLLGRAGMLEAAWDLVEGMSFVRNEKIWGTLLGGCRIHGELKMGEKAAAKLMKISPEKGGYYMLLSAIYVDAGRHVEAAMIRGSIDRRKAGKTVGLSKNSGSYIKYFVLPAALKDVKDGDPLHLPPNG
ncbi:Pentatricopeptide repeat-containing protein [Platanthera guangdongensis]|uniref:Pentatricopeptide repeat-containing protein n=1 Tax=Platanthera guangdongensis TaxID=2320717 RepID=A0ABR2MWE7_9ASPA